MNLKFHEPCASREDCYHVRAGRIGGRIGGVISGRRAVQAGVDFRALGRKGGHISGPIQGPIQGRKNVESGHLKNIAASGGRIGGRNQPYEAKVRGGRNGSREDKVRAGRIGARNQPREVRVRNGRVFARLMSHKRPTWLEARFYGLVFGNPFLSKGFTAQQSDGHGIYDGAWSEHKIVVELDGGGHYVFGDRTENDFRKDTGRKSDGCIVIRETDENGAYLKVLAILEASS